MLCITDNTEITYKSSAGTSFDKEADDKSSASHTIIQAAQGGNLSILYDKEVDDQSSLIKKRMIKSHSNSKSTRKELINTLESIPRLPLHTFCFFLTEKRCFIFVFFIWKSMDGKLLLATQYSRQLIIL